MEKNVPFAASAAPRGTARTVHSGAASRDNAFAFALSSARRDSSETSRYVACTSTRRHGSGTVAHGAHGARSSQRKNRESFSRSFLNTKRRSFGSRRSSSFSSSSRFSSAPSFLSARFPRRRRRGGAAPPATARNASPARMSPRSPSLDDAPDDASDDSPDEPLASRGGEDDSIRFDSIRRRRDSRVRPRTKASLAVTFASATSASAVCTPCSAASCARRTSHRPCTVRACALSAATPSRESVSYRTDQPVLRAPPLAFAPFERKTPSSSPVRPTKARRAGPRTGANTGQWLGTPAAENATATAAFAAVASSTSANVPLTKSPSGETRGDRGSTTAKGAPFAPPAPNHLCNPEAPGLKSSSGAHVAS